jgi:hypothetical protein
MTVRAIERTCGLNIVRLTQNRNIDPVEDILSQLPPSVTSTLYAVLPIDKAIELKQRAPHIKLLLLQLDGAVVEKLTGKPYDPKTEYNDDVIRAALKVIEVKSGTIEYMSFTEMVSEIVKKVKKIAIFNDNMREGFRIALQRIGFDNIELVKTCSDNNCIEINPMGYKSGYRISFPGTAGKLTPEQIADMLITGTARLYYAEVNAETVSLCA